MLCTYGDDSSPHVTTSPQLALECTAQMAFCEIVPEHLFPGHHQFYCRIHKPRPIHGLRVLGKTAIQMVARPILGTLLHK